MRQLVLERTMDSIHHYMKNHFEARKAEPSLNKWLLEDLKKAVGKLKECKA